MLIGCGAALFGLRLEVRFTADRGPSIRSMRTSVPESVPAGFVICGNMSMPEELIPADRCWELLATVSVGRLALSVRALPVIPLSSITWTDAGSRSAWGITSSRTGR